jgi:hypothetical protein
MQEDGILKNLFLYFVTAFVFLVFSASITLAQNFSTNPGPLNPPSGNVSALAECGNTTLTQSSSQTVTELNSVSCNIGGFNSENSYYRAYVLEDFGITGDFEVCEVLLGVESASSISGTQPVSVNLYTSDPEFPDGALTEIGFADIELPDQDLTIVGIPVTATVPAGSQLVVEIYIPDGVFAENSFFIGSNDAPQTGPSYIKAPDCGTLTPETAAAIGFPEMHIVLDVVGNQDQRALLADKIPTLSEWGLMAMAGVLGIAGFIVIGRKKAEA